MEDAAVDACCLINFVAAGRLSDVIRSSRLSWHIPDMVLREVVYVAEEDADPQSATDLLRSQFLDGMLAECRVDAAEQALFVKLAAQLADGEAAALAIAATRRWCLATDDRKAIRLARWHHVRVVTTPELARRWAEHSRASPEVVHDALQRIRKLARFVPRRDEPEFEWWMQSLGDW